MVLRVPLINGSITICPTDSIILNMGHTYPKDWKSWQGPLKVLSLDPCSSLSIWTTFIPYQIHFKQYCMQMTQRLRLLSVHLPVGSLTRMVAGLQEISRDISFELSNIYLWLAANRLSLNFDETKYMIYHTSGCKMDDISLDIRIENNGIERIGKQGGQFPWFNDQWDHDKVISRWENCIKNRKNSWRSP